MECLKQESKSRKVSSLTPVFGVIQYGFLTKFKCQVNQITGGCSLEECIKWLPSRSLKEISGNQYCFSRRKRSLFEHDVLKAEDQSQVPILSPAIHSEDDLGEVTLG